MPATIDGRKLRELRVRKGLTLELLAQRSGVSERAIQDIEKGITLHPRPNTILWIAQTLDVDPETLWCDKDPVPAVEDGPLAFVWVSDRDGHALNRHPVQRERIQIGRDAANDVVLPDPRVSLFHALVVFRGDMIELRDLASANGTFVRGEAIREPRTIELGEPISIDPFVLEIRAADEHVEPAAKTMRIARPLHG